MATSQKLNETGWFYHAPAKPKILDPIGIPPTSQIPGLSDLPVLPPEDPPARGWIRDTDSKYVKLAKQGGRPNLLRFNSPKPRSDRAEGYPRVDWFYLEDNRLEDEQSSPPKQQYQPLLPEYMVHEEYKPEGDFDSNPYLPKRLPYSYDQTSAYQRDGAKVTDKTQKLPEIKQPGFGVRNQKQKGKTVRYNIPQREVGKPPAENLQETRQQAMPVPKETDRTIMSKLLSYGYGADWDAEHKKWEKEHQEALEKEMASTKMGKLESEYQARMSSRESNRSHSHKVAMKAASEGENKKQKEPQQPFKLSKFKNVPSRTVSTRTNQPVIKAN